MTPRPVIVDAHHHFWDPDGADYPWLTDDFAAIHRRYGPEDLEPLLAATGVSRTILVQTRSSIAETESFLATAASTPFVAGVVGWVELADRGVDEALARLRAQTGGERLVAIRHQVHDEPDPDWLRRPNVHRGIAAVGAAGLVYDLLLRPRELPAALDVVRSLPDVRFVIDHLAKPPIREGAIEAWAELIQPFGDLENTWCKISGMVTEADWAAWRPEHLAPFVQYVVELFGPGRLLFGSDWPVCLLAATYGQVFDAARFTLSALSEQEQAAVFGGNAIDVYSLRVEG